MLKGRSKTGDGLLYKKSLAATLPVKHCKNGCHATLLAPLARAHRWLKAIRSGRDIAGLAKADGISEGCLRVHLQLALLAPAIQQAILDGTQPEGLTLHRLTRPEMPADWQAQSRRAGICPA